MSLASHSKLALREGAEIPEKYRAACMLAMSLQQELSSLGKTPETLTDAEIENYIRTNLGGGRMGLWPANPEPPQSLPSLVKRWVERDKWWLSTMLLLTVLVATCWMSAFSSSDTLSLYWGLVCATAGVYFAVVVGRTRRSRLFFAGCGGLVGIVVALMVYVSYFIY